MQEVVSIDWIEFSGKSALIRPNQSAIRIYRDRVSILEPINANRDQRTMITFLWQLVQRTYVFITRSTTFRLLVEIDSATINVNSVSANGASNYCITVIRYRCIIIAKLIPDRRIRYGYLCLVPFRSVPTEGVYRS